MANDLRVVICADGIERSFEAHGELVAVVAAFRAWLASDEWQLPDPVDVDALEREVERLRIEMQQAQSRELLLAEALGFDGAGRQGRAGR